MRKTGGTDKKWDKAKKRGVHLNRPTWGGKVQIGWKENLERITRKNELCRRNKGRMKPLTFDSRVRKG